jgi:hypothetical protein
MKEPVDRPAPYVSALLEAERSAPPPEQEVHDRVRARVAATLIAATTTGAATTAAAAKGASAGVLASLATKATLIAVVVASAGATGGIALHRRQVRARSRALLATTAPAAPNASSRAMSPSLPPAAVASSTVPAPVAEAPAAMPAVAPTPVAAPPPVESRHARPASPHPSDDGVPATKPPETAEELADENALIEAARAALGARDAGSAVGLLERHARLHPAGQMEEEREALWVQALAAKGDGAAARARAAAFRRRFPRSIQLEVVSAALETIP